VPGYGLTDFMTRIGAKGGMSFSTNYDIEFDFKDKDFLNSFTKNDRNTVQLFCDEAQLPNVQSAVGQRSGKFLGEGPVSYPHTRIFTDLSLGFLLDSNLTALKFFNAWYSYIFSGGDVEDPSDPSKIYSGTTSSALSQTPEHQERVNRLKYLDEYSCTLKILKSEPTHTNAGGRTPVAYLLENCYPYAIDTVPLSYGSSQIARLTVNFYYSRHTVRFGNQIDNPKYVPPVNLTDAEKFTGRRILSEINADIA
tara:strand:+ start:45 stop:800 length:756 start_codon:yes stop_codon:yes gene_type:complete